MQSALSQQCRRPAAFGRGGVSAAAACRAHAPPRAVRPAAPGRRGVAPILAAWGAPVEFSPAKVAASGPAAAGLQRVVLDVGAPLAAGYTRPGQYFQVKVGDSKPGFFAVASPPDANNAGALEFLIKPAPGTTAEALAAAPAGAAVSVSPAQGKGFPMERCPPSAFPTLLIFATGSGISPVRALIESGALGAGQRKDVRLYYGTTSAGAAAFADRLDAWRKAGVKVTQVFSDAGGGYVQDAFAKEAAPIADYATTAVVLCGQKEMATAVKEMLGARGVLPDSFLANF